MGWMGYFSMAIAFSLTLRIMCLTDAHPRIAMITETLRRAASDLFHFCVVFSLIFVCFAMVSTLRFGDRSDLFMNLPRSIRTLYNGVPMNLYSDADYVIFVLV